MQIKPSLFNHSDFFTTTRLPPHIADKYALVIGVATLAFTCLTALYVTIRSCYKKAYKATPLQKALTSAPQFPLKKTALTFNQGLTDIFGEMKAIEKAKQLSQDEIKKTINELEQQAKLEDNFSERLDIKENIRVLENEYQDRFDRLNEKLSALYDNCVESPSDCCQKLYEELRNQLHTLSMADLLEHDYTLQK